MEKTLFLLASPTELWEHGKATRQPWPHGCSAQGRAGREVKEEKQGKKSQKKGANIFQTLC